MAALFKQRYRSDHEPDYPSLIRRLTAARDPAHAVYLRRRDRKLWLEFESCWLHILHIQRLVQTFPEAKFILTIRNCYTWLDSLANHVTANDIGPHWRRAQQVYYRPELFAYQRGEEAIRDAGMYPIRAYLSTWAWHNQRVFDVVPKERLLVIRTREIMQSAERIAAFLDIAPESIDVGSGHQYVARRKYRFLERVDTKLLDRTVTECCGELMTRWFPEDAVRQPAGA